MTRSGRVAAWSPSWVAVALLVAITGACRTPDDQTRRPVDATPTSAPDPSTTTTTTTNTTTTTTGATATTVDTSSSSSTTTTTTTTTTVTSTSTSTSPTTTTTTTTVDTTPGARSGRATLDGRWSTSGSDVVDGDGNTVVIRGVNWFGFETAVAMPHGLWTRSLGDMLDQIASLGFNTIRLPFASAMLDDGVRPEALNEQVNGDLVDLTSIELMDRVIDEAGARGLAVILDRHALGPDDRHSLWYDDDYPHERLVDDWLFLAERYADRPHVVGADIYNEPRGEACWGCGDPAVDWRMAAEEAGDAIHTVQPDWLIFVEGVEHVDGAPCHDPAVTDCTWWGGDLRGAFDDPVVLEVADRVVYSPHEYATSVHHQPWFDDPSFPDNLEPRWDRYWGGLARTGAAPIMVGELGTTLDAEVDRIWLVALLDYIDELGAGFTYWTFNPNSGDTGGILRDDWITVDTDKLSLIEPFLVGPFEPVPILELVGS